MTGRRTHLEIEVDDVAGVHVLDSLTDLTDETLARLLGQDERLVNDSVEQFASLDAVGQKQPLNECLDRLVAVARIVYFIIY